jgi:hypothetical protein
MTDENTLADYNIKDFGKLGRYLPSNHKVSSYQYPTRFDSECVTSCQDRICTGCGNDHSFRGSFKDTVTIIDTLPELFKESNWSNCKLQEYVN